MSGDGPDGGGPDGEDDFIFNEYAIDDTLDPLSRLLKYHNSDFSLQRLVLIRELTDTASYAGYTETTNKLLPLLTNFVSDSEPAVRQMFVQQLQPLAQYVVDNGSDAGYGLLLSTFLPYAFELLVDKNVEVGNSAIVALNKLAQMVNKKDVDSQLLHVVNTLAHDERAEDYRVVASQLYNDLSPIFGKDLCTSLVLEEIKTLANDMSFSVRKTVGANLGQLCKVVGAQTAVDKILPIYLSLSKDEIWGVRKACAESIVALSEAVTNEARVAQLIPAFRSLSEDASRWVRVAAYQNLGQLIHTMQRPDITSMFLKIFTDMAFQSEGGDSDFAEYCAFSLPAVAQVIGKDRWRELDDAFATLLKDVQWKVRKSLAFSIHELAKIVGEDIAERSLATAFELFLRDIDEVKYGVIQNADEFLATLSEASREKFVPLVCAVPLESEKWRLRGLVATKLGDLAPLVSAATVQNHIIDMVGKLLEDSVADVRTSTFNSTAMILKHLQSQSNKDIYNGFLATIQGYANRASFQNRQMFAYIVQQAVEIDAQAVFQDLLESYAGLGDDSVTCVRYVVARTLSMSLMNHKDLKLNARVLKLKEKLSADPEQEVAAMAQAKLPAVDNKAKAALYH